MPELLCYNLLDMVESSADRGALPAGVGRYEIRSRLAADPLDEVYDAFDPLIERPVAVKVFPLKPPMPRPWRGCAKCSCERCHGRAA